MGGVIVIIIVLFIAGIIAQLIGLVYYLSSRKYDNEVYKETALKSFVFGTVMFLCSGALCGSMILFT